MKAEKKPYISVSAGFYFKNAPKGYLGLTNENWNFGKKKGLGYAALAYGILVELLDFHLKTGKLGAIQANQEIEALRTLISELKVKHDLH